MKIGNFENTVQVDTKSLTESTIIQRTTIMTPSEMDLLKQK